MLVVTFLEAFQLYLHLASDWFKVALIRSYVTRPALHNSGCFSEMIIGLALRFKTLRPWQNKLGQYSLLQNFDGTRRISKCVHYMTLWLVDKAKKGRKRGKPVKLSAQVKKSIIDSLDTSKGHLTNGASSLQSNGVYGMLSWACAREDSDEMVVHSILVWHVATTICLHKLQAALAKDCNQQAELNVEERGAIDTASSLSHYCAYLIAFAPDLLPGHSFESASKLDKSIQEARKVPSLRGAKTMENKCEILLRIGDTNSLPCNRPFQASNHCIRAGVCMTAAASRRDTLTLTLTSRLDFARLSPAIIKAAISPEAKQAHMHMRAYVSFGKKKDGERHLRLAGTTFFFTHHDHRPISLLCALTRQGSTRMHAWPYLHTNFFLESIAHRGLRGRESS
jgi:hypothetical protein